MSGGRLRRAVLALALVSLAGGAFVGSIQAASPPPPMIA
jgi:hypothetical protein